jgi:hypothetical protein
VDEKMKVIEDTAYFSGVQFFKVTKNNLQITNAAAATTTTTLEAVQSL